MPTIYDVASAAGVSISTVSLAINRPDRVNEKTRARVMAVIAELGYVPKEQAISRARRGVGYVGVLAPFTSYSSFGVRLAGVLDGAGPTTSQVAVFDHPSAASATPFLESLPVSGRLDGIIVMSIPLEADVATRLSRSALPTVLVDSECEGLTSIVVADRAGGRAVADAMLARGHRRVGFIGERQERPELRSPARLRLEGLMERFESAGAPLDPSRVRLVDNRPEAAALAARDLLTGPDRPTALFTHSDLMAATCLRIARELQLRVPEDLAVVGYDDLEWAESLGLTTVRQPLRKSGRLAFEALSALIAGTGVGGTTTTLPVELVLRATL